MDSGRFVAFRPLPLPFPGKPHQSLFHQFPAARPGGEFPLKSRDGPAEITCMSFGITGLYFPIRPRPAGVAPGAATAWNGVASPGEIGRPGDLPVPAGQQFRRWGALVALAAMTLPGSGAAQAAERRPPAAVAETSRSRAAAGVTGPAGTVPGAASPGGLPSGDAGDDATPAPAAPWEAGVVEADGKPLPTAPPPGPVPVTGTPKPATAAPAAAGTGAAAGAAGHAGDLVPAEREYLRPVLISYAQANGLPADLVMALAWVESSWRRTALSDIGAIGVMQLMPVTVTYVSQKLLGLKGNLDPYNATSNIRMGTKFLRRLLD